MSERDTKFAEFAKLLYKELEQLEFTGKWPSLEEYFKAKHLLVAQRAYDLVYHAVDNIGDPDPATDFLTVDIIKHIPDLTEWPKIITTEQEYDEYMNQYGATTRVRQDRPKEEQSS